MNRNERFGLIRHGDWVNYFQGWREIPSDYIQARGMLQFSQNFSHSLSDVRNDKFIITTYLTNTSVTEPGNGGSAAKRATLNCFTISSNSVNKSD